MDNWTTVIKPVNSWFNINLREVWQYRDLIRLFFHRDFIVFYKQTILGPLWFLIQPLLTTVVYTIIFGKIANLPTDGIPHILFYMSGAVIWNYFSLCLTNTSNTFSQNSAIFGKVYFPRLVMPITSVITNLVTFFIQLLLLLAFWFYYYFYGSGIHINNMLFMFPLLIVQMALLGLGTGVLISSLTIKYRDLSFVVGFGVQLWMYSTPIVYPLSMIPEKWQWLSIINPMTMVVETFRLGFLGSGSFDLMRYLLSITMTVLIFFVGVMLFSRVEKSFIDKI
ncbi:MAG: ABC transporter permease [Bacteroidetes bacterium]|nr:ABC transporter permease [Bacteroidota bacterium]